jgi:aspartate aminotransferase
MFESLPVQPGDPILQMMQDARSDSNPEKVDLSVGVYCDEEGKTPVLSAVKEAETRLLALEQTKAYLGVIGDVRFNALVTDLALGERHSVIADQRVSTIQTTGGSAALRIAGELINQIDPGATIWVSDPTWGNHIPLMKAAGLQVKTYPYYDRATAQLDFSAMCQALSTLKPSSAVLIQGGCHNPTGSDLTFAQWQELTEIVIEKELLPLIDVAYHGLGSGFDEDAQGYRYMADRVPEMLLSYSGSKSFGLYRDRAGALIGISRNSTESRATISNLMSISRVLYSMPPAHGAWVIAEILSDKALRTAWVADVAAMRERINSVRLALARSLVNHTKSDRFNFIAEQQGMFSYLGIELEQIRALRQEYSVYMLESSRINVAGATSRTVETVALAVGDILSS